MTYLLKRIVRSLGLGDLARSLRRLIYLIFDSIGTGIFVLVKVCGFHRPMKEFQKNAVRKVLIVRLDGIGDLILSTPAIRAVRSTFPKAEIHMLVREYTKVLVINNPNIDKLLLYKRDKLSKDYDLAIALHPGLKQNYLTFISRAKFRVGYTAWGGGFFLTHRIRDDRATRVRHEIDSALEVVGTVGCKTEDKRPEVSITGEGERFAEDFFKGNNLSHDNLIVAVHPGARQAYIRWKKEGFAEVSDRLIREQNANVILIGGEEERGLVKEVADLMEGPSLFAVGLRLTQLISLLSRSTVFIGNSSGPMHIAAASGIPVVAIFGAIHPLDSYQEWGPSGKGNIVVHKDAGCKNCHPGDCRDYRCMSLITPDHVFEAVQKQLRKHNHNVKRPVVN